MIGIRAKVLLASSALLLIPWIGYAFVAEMERFLRDGQARMLSDNARAVATLVQERARVTAGGARIPRDIAAPLANPITLDGSVEDWIAQGADVRGYGGERLAELHGAWTPQSLSFSHALGRQGDYVYAFFDVSDDRIVYCDTGENAICDHVRVSVQYSGQRLQRYTVGAPQPGPLVVRASESPLPIEGVWREREHGYTVELRLPAGGLQLLAFAVADVDEPGGNVNAVIVTEERLAEERTGFDVTPDVAAVLEGMSRANLRIWLVDGIGNVILRTGTVEAAPPPEPPAEGLGRIVEWVREMLIAPPRRSFVDPLAQASRLDTPEIEWALAGQAVSRVNERPAGSRVDAAAHPIQIKGETVGATLVEQSSESIARIRELALERLLIATLAAFFCGALILVIYVSRLSGRLRKLRDEAERAIDSAGRVRELAAGSTSGDEIGDLSRSYSAVLKRLAQYTDYLEHLARRLNHELRTPIAVVRSSLDNLRSEGSKGSAVYIDRAEAGLDRLAAILSRMSEATRLEEIMGRAERESFDLNAVVRGCAEGYRLAYAPREIRYSGPAQPIRLSGLPDLIAQMLDKLVENAAEHATPGTPIDVALEPGDVDVVLRVRNVGPALPAAMEGRLFESMVSVQAGTASGIPHLGLGLYIVRLIAQFHHGSASAANREDEPGVEVTVRLARYLSDPA